MSHLDPDPFIPYPTGDWEAAKLPEAIAAVEAAIALYGERLVTREALWEDMNRAGVKYWLWYMHHKHDNRWKNLGRPYWSIRAYLAWRRHYFSFPPEERLDSRGLPHIRTFKKRKTAGRDGLYHEHVVPQRVSFRLIVDDKIPPAVVLGRNIGAVITSGENDDLRRDHPDLTDPWLRYKGSDIQFIENPKWTKAQRDALIRYDLLWTKPIPPFESR